MRVVLPKKKDVSHSRRKYIEHLLSQSLHVLLADLIFLQ